MSESIEYVNAAQRIETLKTEYRMIMKRANDIRREVKTIFANLPLPSDTFEEKSEHKESIRKWNHSLTAKLRISTGHAVNRAIRQHLDRAAAYKAATASALKIANHYGTSTLPSEVLTNLEIQLDKHFTIQ